MSKKHLTFTSKDVLDGVKRDLKESIDHTDQIEVQELSEAMLKNKYLTELDACVDRALKKTQGDFYIEVITVLEKPVRKIIRRRFLWRLSCPTPVPGSAVWKFNRGSSSLEFMWDLPAKAACDWMIHNKHALDLQKHGPLLRTVMDYFDKTLLNRARAENGERDNNAPIHRIVDDSEFERISRDNHSRRSFSTS